MTRNERGRVSGPFFFDSPMSVHPVILLSAWILFVSLVPGLEMEKLLLCSLLLSLLLAKKEVRSVFVRLLRRTRWLLLALVMLYGFFTQGQALIAHWQWGPSEEGLRSGVIQALRLVLILLSLASILAALNGNRLIAGLYGLIKPLGYLGMAVDRMVVRLALTLRMAETQGAIPLNSTDLMKSLGANQGQTIEVVEFELTALTWIDGVFVLCFVALIGALLW